MTAVMMAVCGLGTATGLLVIGAAALRLRSSELPAPRRMWRESVRTAPDRSQLARLVVAAGAGVVAGLCTGWLVGAVLTAAAGWFIPRLVGPDRDHARRLARIEGVASWTEMLRDVLSAAAGLEQAIVATAPRAPGAIRGEITVLAARLDSGQRLAPALRRLADDLADPTADLVIAALVLAAEHQARQLSELLGSLATTAREQAAMRMRVETGRARTRTSVRVIVGSTLGFAAVVVATNREYFDVYNTAVGQTVLLAIGAVFCAGFAWLGRIAGSGHDTRVLQLTSHATGKQTTTTGVSGGEQP